MYEKLYERPKTKTPLLQWLRDFWNYEKSDYVQDKLSHGKRISQRYCHDQTLIIRYWEEYFSKDFTVEELTTKHYADHKTEEALLSVCSASNEIFTEMLLA